MSPAFVKHFLGDIQLIAGFRRLDARVRFLSTRTVIGERAYGGFHLAVASPKFLPVMIGYLIGEARFNLHAHRARAAAQGYV